MTNHMAGRCALALVSLAVSGIASAAAYTTTFLETLGGTFSTANAINNTGQVVGVAYTPGDVEGHATRWNGTKATDMGTLGGTHSWAYDINDAGQAVGTSYLPGNIGRSAIIWNGSVATVLPSLSGTGSPSGQAYAINNAGQVAGSSYVNDVNQQSSRRAVIWDGTAVSDLGLVAGIHGDSWANGINDSGQAVGVAASAGPSLAASWTGSVGSFLSENGMSATAINNAGQIAGTSWVNGAFRATLWNDGVATYLPVLGGPYLSSAAAINNAGQVVGKVSGDQDRATLWTGTTAIDLNTYLDASLIAAGWILEEANDINDSGAVVGRAHNRFTNEYRGYILSATVVPEPHSCALMLAGLVVLTAVGRRRTYFG